MIGSLLQKEEGEREREREKKKNTPNHDLLRTRLFSDTASRRTPDTLAARVSALATAAARRTRLIEPMCILQLSRLLMILLKLLWQRAKLSVVGMPSR